MRCSRLRDDGFEVDDVNEESSGRGRRELNTMEPEDMCRGHRTARSGDGNDRENECPLMPTGRCKVFNCIRLIAIRTRSSVTIELAEYELILAFREDVEGLLTSFRQDFTNFFV